MIRSHTFYSVELTGLTPVFWFLCIGDVCCPRFHLDPKSSAYADWLHLYIANIVKCRPPENRDPLGVEQDACIDYLRRQVKLLNPKIVVCLGRIAAMRIIRSDFKISREHGQWFEKGGLQMMAVYHPAALLRDPRRRPEAFDDFKGLQAKIRELCEHTKISE